MNGSDEPLEARVQLTSRSRWPIGSVGSSFPQLLATTPMIDR